MKGLLSIGGFVDVIRGLLTHKDGYVRRKALYLLQDKLKQDAQVRPCRDAMMLHCRDDAAVLRCYRARRARRSSC